MGREHGFILPFYIHLPVYFLSYMFISISEEGVFRGCILGGLLNRHGVTFSIIFSSLLFGLYHYSYPSLFYGLSGAIMMATYMFQSFTARLFLAYFYHKTGGSLVGPVSYHFSQMFFNIPSCGWSQRQYPLESSRSSQSSGGSSKGPHTY